MKGEGCPPCRSRGRMQYYQGSNYALLCKRSTKSYTGVLATPDLSNWNRTHASIFPGLFSAKSVYFVSFLHIDQFNCSRTNEHDLLVPFTADKKPKHPPSRVGFLCEERVRSTLNFSVTAPGQQRNIVLPSFWQAHVYCCAATRANAGACEERPARPSLLGTTWHHPNGT